MTFCMPCAPVPFLQEMCSLAKHLAPEAREGVLSKLQGLGLFEVLSAVMVHGDGELKLRATDILLSVVDQDPAPLKHFLTQASLPSGRPPSLL